MLKLRKITGGENIDISYNVPCTACCIDSEKSKYLLKNYIYTYNVYDV